MAARLLSGAWLQNRTWTWWHTFTFRFVGKFTRTIRRVGVIIGKRWFVVYRSNFTRLNRTTLMFPIRSLFWLLYDRNSKCILQFGTLPFGAHAADCSVRFRLTALIWLVRPFKTISRSCWSFRLSVSSIVRNIRSNLMEYISCGNFRANLTAQLISISALNAE